MDDEDLRSQLELLKQMTEPVLENNLSSIFDSPNDNSNTNTNTTPNSSNNVTEHTFAPPPPPVNTPINSPRTSNVVSAMITTPSIISIPASDPSTANYNFSFPPNQNPAIFFPDPDHVVEHQLEPNWEAINAFLRGQVLPGADVERLHTCIVCGAEYVNAQALGGHMGMHRRRSKNLRDEGTSSKHGRSKKPRRH